MLFIFKKFAILKRLKKEWKAALADMKRNRTISLHLAEQTPFTSRHISSEAYTTRSKV